MSFCLADLFSALDVNSELDFRRVVLKIPKILPDQQPQKCQRPTILVLAISNYYLLNTENPLGVSAKGAHCLKTYSRGVESQSGVLGQQHLGT